jgi:hypothetical protein
MAAAAVMEPTPLIPDNLTLLRTALKRLVDECQEVLDTLATLNEDQLPAVVHNLWYEALGDARGALESDRGSPISEVWLVCPECEGYHQASYIGCDGLRLASEDLGDGGVGEPGRLGDGPQC